MVEKRKIGRSKTGALVLNFVETDDKVAVFVKSHKDTYRMGRPNMTTARKEGVEYWPIDPDALKTIRRLYAPKVLIVFEADTEDYWVSLYDDWFDHSKRTTRAFGKDGGKVWAMLPLSCFRHRRSTEDLRLAKR